MELDVRDSGLRSTSQPRGATHDNAGGAWGGTYDLPKKGLQLNRLTLTFKIWKLHSS